MFKRRYAYSVHLLKVVAGDYEEDILTQEEWDLSACTNVVCQPSIDVGVGHELAMSKQVAQKLKTKIHWSYVKYTSCRSNLLSAVSRA